MEFGGIFGLIILALDIWAIVQILQGSAGTGTKALWIVVIVLLPLIGLLIWFFFGRAATG